MALFDPAGITPRRRHSNHVEWLVLDRPLHRVLAFTRRSIDDVVNSPMAKREVLGYYKLQCQVRRRCEAVDLDRWWSGQDTRPRRG